MKQQQVILIGASVRSLAQAAIEDGLAPCCVDMFGDRDLRSQMDDIRVSRTIERFEEAANQVADVPANVPAIVVGGGELDEGLLSALAQQRTVAGLSASRQRQWRSPDSLFPLLRDGGCAVPRWSVQPEHRDSAVDRWLQKQTNSSGGLGVRRWSAAGLRGENHANATYLQEHLEGPVFSCTWYSEPTAAAPVPAGLALQLSGVSELNASGFEFCGNIGVTDPSPRLLAGLQASAAKLHATAGLAGFWGMDCVLHQGVPHVIEVNLRISASHETHRCEPVGVVGAQLAAFGQMPAGRMSFQTQPMVRLVVYAPRRLSVTPQLTDRLFAFRHTACCTADFWLADIPEAHTTIAAHTPLCSVYLPDINRVTASDLRQLADLLPQGCWRISPEWLHKYQGQIAALRRL